MIATDVNSQVAVKLENHETRIHHLEEWELKQNSHLEKIQQRLDQSIWFLMALLGGVLTTLVAVIFK